jgi:hypothetical protein
MIYKALRNVRCGREQTSQDCRLAVRCARAVRGQKRTIPQASWTPIVELENDAALDIELDPATAFDGVISRVDLTLLTYPMRPHAAIDFDWPTLPAVVINNCEISLSVRRRGRRTS